MRPCPVKFPLVVKVWVAGSLPSDSLYSGGVSARKRSPTLPRRWAHRDVNSPAPSPREDGYQYVAVGCGGGG